jgi:hypothetical protein
MSKRNPTVIKKPSSKTRANSEKAVMNTVKAILAPIPAEAQDDASKNRRSASALVNSLLVQTLYTYPIRERRRAKE